MHRRVAYVCPLVPQVMEVVGQPIDQMSIAELHAYREKQLESLMAKAKDYLQARAWLLLDGQTREEITALDARIEDTHARVRELESLDRLRVVGKMAAIPIDGWSKEMLAKLRIETLEPEMRSASEYLQERGWLMTRSSSAAEPRPEVAGAEASFTARAMSSRFSRDRRRSKEGGPQPEMAALQARIK